MEINSTRLTWKEYLVTINSSDAYITRYFHYLRLLAIQKTLQRVSLNRKNKRCLDIGCNRGYFSKMAADLGFTVDAIDSDLDLSRTINHPNIHFKKTDIQNFPQNGEYDIILFFEVLEHIPFENRGMVLEKVHDLLAEDGILIFSGPNCLSFLYGAGYCKERFINYLRGTTCLNWHYHIPFFSFNQSLVSSGFVIEEWTTDGVLPIISDRMEQFLDRFTGHIATADNVLSKILKGLGANYYCIAQKKQT